MGTRARELEGWTSGPTKPSNRGAQRRLFAHVNDVVAEIISDTSEIDMAGRFLQYSAPSDGTLTRPKQCITWFMALCARARPTCPILDGALMNISLDWGLMSAMVTYNVERPTGRLRLLGPASRANDTKRQTSVVPQSLPGHYHEEPGRTPRRPPGPPPGARPGRHPPAPPQSGRPAASDRKNLKLNSLSHDQQTLSHSVTVVTFCRSGGSADAGARPRGPAGSSSTQAI